MSTFQVMPALDKATEAALADSIKTHGVIVPVVVDQHGNIIDGHNRVRIAKALGRTCSTEERVVASEDEARELARTLNEDRRQLLDIDQRRGEVRRLREQGHSTRAIGGALGVSNITVRRDLNAGATDVAPATKSAQSAEDDGPVRTKPSDFVTGKDGKTYPATRATLDQAALAAIEARRLAGEKVADMAPTVGLSVNGLHDALNRYRKTTGALSPKTLLSTKAHVRDFDDSIIRIETTARLWKGNPNLVTLHLAANRKQREAWAKRLTQASADISAIVRVLKEKQ